jgi:hypothetical protein
MYCIFSYLGYLQVYKASGDNHSAAHLYRDPG